ncbi:hypothetical protein GCM10027456_43260 [Kineosporia babensis]
MLSLFRRNTDTQSNIKRRAALSPRTYPQAGMSVHETEDFRATAVRQGRPGDPGTKASPTSHIYTAIRDPITTVRSLGSRK